MRARSSRARPTRQQVPPAGALPRGLTLDTGALVAYERAARDLAVRLKEAHETGRRITVPTVVVAEAWRGGHRSARVARLIEACVVEALHEPLARRAGEVLAKAQRATAIDAIVAVSAASRRDVVLTTDVEDLSALASHVEGVDVIGL